MSPLENPPNRKKSGISCDEKVLNSSEDLSASGMFNGVELGDGGTPGVMALTEKYFQPI